jgi:hypothetical protein
MYQSYSLLNDIKTNIPHKIAQFYRFQQESWLLPSAVISSVFYNAKSLRVVISEFSRLVYK